MFLKVNFKEKVKIDESFIVKGGSNVQNLEDDKVFIVYLKKDILNGDFLDYLRYLIRDKFIANEELDFER